MRRKNFVKYCVTYDTKTDNCLNCIPAYYANYTADSQIYVSKCTYCNNNSLAFGTDQACNLNTNDCKCQSCVKPLKSYYDVVKWICTARQQINCLEYSANEDKCTSCNHYFVLTKDGKCI